MADEQPDAATTFEPGPGLLLVGGSTTVLLGGDATPAVVDRLRRIVRSAPTVDVLLDALTADGLRSMPSFGCAVVEGRGVRVVVRGSVLARVWSGGLEQVVEARSVSTWSEQLLADVVGFALEGPGAVAPAHSAYWLADGVVPAASAHRVLVAGTREASAPVASAVVGLPPPPPPGPAAPAQDADRTITGEGEDEPSADDGTDADADDETDADVEDEPVGAPAAVAAAPPPEPAAEPWADAEATSTRTTTVTAGSDGAVGDGDHDGLTVAPSALRDRGRPPAAGRAGRAAPLVEGVRCSLGHANPPTAPTCTTCGGPIASRDVALLPRPTLGRLSFEHGPVVEVDAPVLIGRQPGPALPIAGEVPHLVDVPDPDKALSRTHVEVRVQGWDVLVVDRNSLNHTFVEAPGGAPVQLRPGEQCVLTPGTRVQLADVGGFTFEGGRR